MKEYKRNNFDNKSMHEAWYNNMAMYFPIFDYSWETTSKFNFEIQFTISYNRGLDWLIKRQLYSKQ